MLQSTLDESEGCQRASTSDNRYSVDSLHTTRRYDHTWADLPLSHPSSPKYSVMKWIATYMALSRVQSLKQLRSIGLTTTIRDIIDNGPPEGFLTRFLNIFGEKIGQTQIAVDEAMAELGWLDGATAENGAGATEHTTS